MGDNKVGIVNGYNMDLYCDHPDCMNARWHGRPDDNFCGYDRQSTFKAARKNGWLLNIKGVGFPDSVLGSGKALCPKHSDKIIGR